jgi:hypothetical protein
MQRVTDAMTHSQREVCRLIELAGERALTHELAVE